MKAFVDTSSLFKKYVKEEGSGTFDSIIQDMAELVISPVTWIEMHSVIERRLREKLLTRKEAEWIKKEARRDFNYFRVLRWSHRTQRPGGGEDQESGQPSRLVLSSHVGVVAPDRPVNPKQGGREDLLPVVTCAIV